MTELPGGEILVEQRQLPALGADARRFVVRELELAVHRPVLVDAHAQPRRSRTRAGHQLSVDAPDARILLEELQPLLEPVHVQRGGRAERDAIRDVRST